MNVPKNIFREYDVRGIVGEQLTPEFARALGRAYASALAITTSPFVAILEGDDTWPATKLEEEIPFFDDPAVVQHQYLIRMPNGAQSMRHDEARAAFEEDRQGGLESRFGLGVDAARGFVQDQNARVSQKRAGETNQLALPGR